MSKKQIDGLVPDILSLFQGGHECNEANVEALGSAIAMVVAKRLVERRDGAEDYLRMSNLGKPDRRLWYDTHYEGDQAEELRPEAKIKFLFGDILELLLLFLAKEAGHEVTHEQEEVEVDGVIGHVDAVIDGVVVDCKSASTFSFGKFKSGELRENDPFGYMEQLAGYSTALGSIDGAFLAIDKTLGNICLMKVDKDELEALNTKDRIQHLRGVLESDSPPDRCYAPEPIGESGNLKLGVNCSYCPHKFHCWSDSNDGIGLRTFIYAKGPVHMTKVVKEPQVLEVTF